MTELLPELTGALQVVKVCLVTLCVTCFKNIYAVGKEKKKLNVLCLIFTQRPRQAVECSDPAGLLPEQAVCLPGTAGRRGPPHHQCCAACLFGTFLPFHPISSLSKSQ